MNPTYYQTLGVARTATPAQIKAAFKALAIKYHPDKHGGSVAHEARFKQVNEAYQVLSDPRKKQQYDLKLYYSTPRPTNFGATSPYQAANMYRQGGAHSGHYNRPPTGRQYQAYTPPPPPKQPHASTPPRSSKTRPYERTWRDYAIAVMMVLCLAGFGLVLKYTMDHVTAVDNYETAMGYIKEKRYSEAHSLLREAVTFKPTYGDAYLKLAELQLVVFQAPQAAQINYTAAFQNLDRVQPQSYYMRARSYLATGDYHQAEQDLTRALQRDSTLAMAALDRGIIRLHNLGRVKASIPDFSSYLSHGSDSSYRAQAYQFRGYAYYLTGNFVASQADFHESIRLEPRNAVTYALFADLKLSMRETSAACSYYEVAYNLGDHSVESSLKKHCADHR